MEWTKMTVKTSILVLSLAALSSCDLARKVEERAKVINRFEDVALQLAKENRGLEGQIDELRFQIQQLQNEKNYLQIQLDEWKGKQPRKTASLATKIDDNDPVKFDVFKWTPDELMAVAEKEFENKNYEKSAQFFEAFAKNFPEYKGMDDRFFFFAGMAAYESGSHDDWALKNFGKIIEKFPASPFFRQAKLWMGLTHLKLGDHKKFFKTAEEFRKKYRNTSEWEVLSKHYEKIVQNYKN